MKKIKDEKPSISDIDQRIRAFLDNNPLRSLLTDRPALTAKQRFDNINWGEEVLMLLQHNNIELQEHDIFYGDILNIVYNLEMDIVMDKARLMVTRALRTPSGNILNINMAELLFNNCVYHYTPQNRHTRKTNFPELYYFCSIQSELDMVFIWSEMERHLKVSNVRKLTEEIKIDIFNNNRIYTIKDIADEY